MFYCKYFNCTLTFLPGNSNLNSTSILILYFIKTTITELHSSHLKMFFHKPSGLSKQFKKYKKLKYFIYKLNNMCRKFLEVVRQASEKLLFCYWPTSSQNPGMCPKL